MSDIKACPACGGTGEIEAWTAGVAFRVSCQRCRMCGPESVDRPGAVAAWNALPRWPDWKPASEPPEVPEGHERVLVLAEQRDGELNLIRYRTTSGWPSRNFVRWCYAPLPPGPGEMKP